MNYFLHIGYDGTNYRGWQRQTSAPSVQETIEKCLHRIFKKHITVYGCGRTDAGVHASQYILNITPEAPLDFDLIFRLNKNLPNDIVAYDIWEMEENLHARYDATSRSYDYFIHGFQDTVLDKYSSHYEIEGLNIEAMQKAAQLFLKYEDFKAVCKQAQLYKHTLCKVTEAKLYVNEEEKRLRFSITANRFLKNMIRLSIAFLLQIGRGEMTLEEFEAILASGKEIEDMKPALPNGLFLSRVEYPYLKVSPRIDMCSLLKKGLEHDL